MCTVCICFFKDTAATDIYTDGHTRSLHDALPILPLILAASGELVSERAGVLNLSLEGMMLTAAFFGALGSWATGVPVLGILCAVLATMVLADRKSTRLNSSH